MTPSIASSSSAAGSSSSIKKPTRTSEHHHPPPALSFSSHAYPSSSSSSSSDPHSHWRSQDLREESSSCSSPPTSPTWREARTRDWPVPAQRRRRYDAEGDAPPTRERSGSQPLGRGLEDGKGSEMKAKTEAEVVRAVAALEKDLPGARLLLDGQGEEEEAEALRARRHRSKKSRRENQQSTATARRKKGSRSRSTGTTILLPLQYLLLILLHLGFWIITASLRALARSKRWLRRRGSAGVEELARLEEELLDIRRRNALRQEEKGVLLGSSREEIRVPQHVALAFPPSPPPSSNLIARLLFRYFAQLVAPDSEAVSSHKSSGGLFGQTLPPLARQIAYEDEEAARRILSLRSAVRWSALLGVAEVSVWDEGGEISRWLASGSEGGYEPCSGMWRMVVDLDEESVPIVVEVRDGERRVHLANKTSKTKLQLQNGGVTSEKISGSPLLIVLNLLTPKWDGRAAFAALSDTFVNKIRREEEDTVSSDDHSHAGKNGSAGTLRDRSSKRIERIGVAEVEEELKAQGLPLSEPDLLIVSGGDPIARTLSDFPRWMIRVTEIFHAPPSASLCSRQCSDVIRASTSIAQLSIDDFFAALEQFTNAEQRYGK